MNPVKVNSRTGQVAVAAEGTGPQKSNVTIYNPGEYKINLQTNQVAVRKPGGGYEIHDLTPDQAAALSGPDAILRKQTGQIGSGIGEKTTGEGEAAARGFQQGATLNLSDEIGALTSAAMANAQGREIAQDPGHPVTGRLTTDLLAQYLNQVAGERADNKAALESHPRIFKGSRLAGSLIPSAALPSANAVPAIGFGALQGAAAGAGGADTQDLKGILFNTMIGAGAGAAGGALGVAANKVFASNTPSGMAYNAIDQASPGGIVNLADDTARTGGSPAEQSNVLADTLRNYSEQAPKTAAGLVGGAQTRMAQVNQQAKGAVDTYLSPENARLLSEKLSELARITNDANYEGKAYQNPAVVSLVKEIMDNPAVQDALPAVQKLAAVQGRPDPVKAGFSTIDLDALKRALGTMSSKAFDSTPENTLMGPEYGSLSRNINNLATDMTPALGVAQREAASASQALDAIDLGAKALAPSREAADIAAEYAVLPPQAQEAYRAGLATKLRAMIDAKKTGADAGAIFDTPGLADKLIAAGFPKPAVDKIVNGGKAAREVLNALQGGSDTAQKLLAAEAGKSPMSKVTAKDVILAALTNIPTMFTTKAMNITGQGIERSAAKKVVEALASQGPDALRGLIFASPQSAAPLFNILARSGGVEQGLSLFPRRGGQ